MSLKDLITCPITQEVMVEPVILSDGHTYEKSAIVRWLETHATSPMTNLPLAHRNFVQNHMVQSIIDAYRNGSLNDDKGSFHPNTTSVVGNPRPILLSKETAAYVVQSDFSLIFSDWKFNDVKFELSRGNVLWTSARYKYVDEFFLAIDGLGFVCENQLRKIPHSTEPFVIQALHGISYRRIPNLSRSVIVDGVDFSKGRVASGSLSIKDSNGTTFYYLEHTHKGFVFDLKENKVLLKTVPIETRTSNNPWVLEVAISNKVALRAQPDYNMDNVLTTLEPGEMIASTKRIVGQFNDYVYWVKVRNISGWVFSTREGNTILTLVPSAPRTISLMPGNGIRFACDEIDRWVLICEKEDKNNQRTQTIHWSDQAPYQVCHQINNCTKKGRKITEIAFRGDRWYLSGEKYDGSGAYCWGNISESTCNASVAIGAFNYQYSEYGYAVCYQNGGFSTEHLSSDLLDSMHKANNRITNIWISHDGDEYFFRAGNSWFWTISNKYMQKELKNTHDGGVHRVAKFNDGSWLVLRGKSFTTSVGVPDYLTNLIQRHYDDQKKVIEAQERRVTAYHKAMSSC